MRDQARYPRRGPSAPRLPYPTLLSDFLLLRYKVVRPALKSPRVLGEGLRGRETPIYPHSHLQGTLKIWLTTSSLEVYHAAYHTADPRIMTQRWCRKKELGDELKGVFPCSG